MDAAKDVVCGSNNASSANCIPGSDPTGSGATGTIVPGGSAPLASGNEVTVESNVGDMAVVGGGTLSGGLVDKNQVILSKGAEVGAGGPGGSGTGSVFGGVSVPGGVVSENSVSMADGVVHKDVVGGAIGQPAGSPGQGPSPSGKAIGNAVKVTGGTIHGSVYGGSLKTSGEASGNSVRIGDPAGGFSVSVSKSVSGGTSETGIASNNTVDIFQGAINGDVHGGLLEDGTGGKIEGNAISIKGAGIEIGGIVSAGAITATGRTGLDGNDVTVEGEAGRGDIRIKDVYGAGAFGASGGKLTGSTVLVRNATVTGGVTGGLARAGDSEVSGITVELDNVSVGELRAGVIGNVGGGGTQNGIGGNTLSVRNSSVASIVVGTIHSDVGSIRGNALVLENSSVSASIATDVGGTGNTANDVTFRSGANSVGSTVTASGTVSFLDGDNKVGGAVNAEAVAIAGGRNALKDVMASKGSVTIDGGQSLIDGALSAHEDVVIGDGDTRVSGDVTASGGDVRLGAGSRVFSGTVTANKAVALGGGRNVLAAIAADRLEAGGASYNHFTGQITATRGATFDGDSRNVLGSDISASSGAIAFYGASESVVEGHRVFAASGGVSVASRLALAPGGALVTAFALAVAPTGSLDVGLGTVSAGQVRLEAGATLGFAAKGADQGAISSAGTLATTPGRIYLLLGATDQFDPSRPIISAAAGSIDQGTEFHNLFHRIAVSGTSVAISGPIPAGEA
ncbi:MAG: hypothetical protein LBP92_00080, partial [Deltaproteobacteria bacterium]|nr:hypothetical protein [Deltaproteobacteria bacterium]